MNVDLSDGERWLAERALRELAGRLRGRGMAAEAQRAEDLRRRLVGLLPQGPEAPHAWGTAGRR